MKFKNLVFWRAIVLGIVIAATLPAAAQTNTSRSDREKQVRAFIDAFNLHSVEKMLEIAEEGIQWLNVNDAKVSAYTSGKKALGQSMARYFRSCPSCQSSLEWVNHTEERVVALELATWKDKSGKIKSIRSLAVYEFSNGKISRVYYFPDEFDTPKTKESK